jgi:hypothetical protein
MLKKVVILAFTIILLSAAFPLHLRTSHGSSGAVVTVQPQDSFGLAPDETFTVNITVSNITQTLPLYAWQFYLYYQNAVLNATVTGGIPGVQEGPFLDPTFNSANPHSLYLVTTYTDHYNATYGLMWVSCTLLGNATKAYGSGTLANVTFLTVGSGLSVLHLANVLLISSPAYYINKTYYPAKYINYTEVDGEAYVGKVDVAVTQITTPTDIRQGSLAVINVTAQNRGGITETFDVTLVYNSSTTPIGEQSVVNLPGGGTKILQFAWNTASVPMGEYNLTATASSVPGQGDLSDLTISLQVYVGIRDLAITSVTPSVTTAPVGMPINFSVTVQNKGQATETCNVSLNYVNYTTPIAIGTDSIPLNSGAYKTIAFTWNTTRVVIGNYTITAYVQPLPFETNTTNNKLTCTVDVVDDPDIALTNVTQRIADYAGGYITPIQVTVKNLGPLTETFNVTAYANKTIIIQTLPVTVASGKSATVTLSWNTSGLALGHYTISADAQPLPYQTDTKYDDFNSSMPILMTIAGDLGGGVPPKFLNCDGVVDGKDLALFLQCYHGTAPAQYMYLGDLGGGVPPTFFKRDGVVDGKDLALFLQCYKGQGPK